MWSPLASPYSHSAAGCQTASSIQHPTERRLSAVSLIRTLSSLQESLIDESDAAKCRVSSADFLLDLHPFCCRPSVALQTRVLVKELLLLEQNEPSAVLLNVCFSSPPIRLWHSQVLRQHLRVWRCMTWCRIPNIPVSFFFFFRSESIPPLRTCGSTETQMCLSAVQMHRQIAQ